MCIDIDSACTRARKKNIAKHYEKMRNFIFFGRASVPATAYFANIGSPTLAHTQVVTRKAPFESAGTALFVAVGGGRES